jgi:hypothetical protein
MVPPLPVKGPFNTQQNKYNLIYLIKIQNIKQFSDIEIGMYFSEGLILF